MSLRPRVFRLRVVLKANRPVRLQPHQAGMVYAVVAEANGLALGVPPALPEGVMVEAVEQCRPQVEAFASYAFGLTLLASSVDEAHQRVRILRRGFIALGRRDQAGKAAFRGNFTLQSIGDLVSDRCLFDDTPPSPIADEDLARELQNLATAPRITLRFITPLRMSRSKLDRDDRHSFFGRQFFDPQVFLRRLRGRLETLGFREPGAAAESTPSPVAVVENTLVWLDVTYGGGPNPTKLGGALGDVVLTGLTRADLELLVPGQYVGVGLNTRFGHGHYRIAQLGGDPYACPRSVGLRDLAFGPQFLDRAAERYDLEPGRAGELLRDLRRGAYVPAAPVPVTITQGSKQRRLSIPPRADRTLQRAVLDCLGPTLDPLFEHSSLAYRKGRGRFDAPQRLELALRDGYRWALKADFADFFDTVPHDDLQRRLHAYLADPGMVGLLMNWVRNGAPFPDQGLPTGAVISPLLSNLYLDEFDETLQRLDARLIRYADDFVILFKDRTSAEAIYAAAEAAAENLRLSLNADKTALLDLSEPFEWLGFRFWRDEEWEKTPTGEPVPIDQIGWRDTSRDLVAPGPIRLPGETDEAPVATRALIVVGSNVQWIDQRGDDFRFGRTGAPQAATEIPVERVAELICLGYPSPSSATLRRLAETDIPLVFATSTGAGDVWLKRGVLEDPEVIRAQMSCHDHAAWRLDVCRALIGAKLHNYAALAAAVPERKPQGDTAAHLRDLAQRTSRCASVEQLLGLEGAAAALWYRHLGQRLHPQFAFHGRQSPGADDAVNVMLNLGQTTLHRLLMFLLDQQGFAPSLGILHVPRRGHAALASDLQELFRHLVDRVVIEASYDLQPAQFRRVNHGPFALEITPSAQKHLRTALYQAWQRHCRSAALATPQSYLQHFGSQVRSFRRHLLDRELPWQPFRHPFPPVSTDDSAIVAG